MGSTSYIHASLCVCFFVCVHYIISIHANEASAVVLEVTET